MKFTKTIFLTVLTIIFTILRVLIRIGKNIYIILTTNKLERDEALRISHEKDRQKNHKQRR